MPASRELGRAAPSVPVSRWVAAIATVQFGALVATSSRYGYHPDEMYFIVAGGHPAFGYPDQPPLVPLLSWVMHVMAPGSLLVLRLPSAVAAAVTTVVTALISREIGGGGRSQVIAAGCAACSGFALAACHIVSTTTFDLLSTTLLCWLVIRAVTRHTGRPLFAAGVVAGIGCEAKPQVALVAVALVVALAVAGPRWPLRSPWFAAGVGAALVIAAPYVMWQAVHGWPQLTVADHVAGTAEDGRAGFVPFQLIMVSPLLVPVWVAGLAAPFRVTALRPLRIIPLSYAMVAAVYLAGDGKAYYLASLYPALLGLGAVSVAAWTARHQTTRHQTTRHQTTRHRATVRTAALGAAVAVSVAMNAYLALPLVPASSLQGSAVIALNPDEGETVGWPRFIDTVSRAWQAIPAARRVHSVIFTSSYSEAAAVDVLGHSHGLPDAYSGHNAFSGWGPPAADVTSVLLLGYDGAGDAAPYFDQCARLATVNDGVGLDNDEQGLPVLLCRPTSDWTHLWPELRHYN